MFDALAVQLRARGLGQAHVYDDPEGVASAILEFTQSVEKGSIA